MDVRRGGTAHQRDSSSSVRISHVADDGTQPRWLAGARKEARSGGCSTTTGIGRPRPTVRTSLQTRTSSVRLIDAADLTAGIPGRGDRRRHGNDDRSHRRTSDVVLSPTRSMDPSLRFSLRRSAISPTSIYGSRMPRRSTSARHWAEGEWTMVANLPYNVGTGIILDTLQTRTLRGADRCHGPTRGSR